MAVEFFKQQLTTVPANENRDLSGQVVVVTGASQGLGLEMGRMLAKMQPRKLILTSRSAAKSAEKLAQLKKESGNPNIEFWDLDLNSNTSIKTFARKIESEQDARLDLLFLNAGIQLYKFTLSEDHETTMQTNVYGTYLLALLLHPIMKTTTGKRGQLGQSRTVISSSDTHTMFSAVPLDKLLKKMDSEQVTNAAQTSKDAREKQLDMFPRYMLSKFVLQAVFTEMHNHLDPKEVIFATANPGLCKTNLTANVDNLLLKMIRPIFFTLFARSAETGARCLLYPGLLASGSDIHGKYFSSSTDYPISAYLQSEEGQQISKQLYKDLVKTLAGVDDQAVRVLV